MASILRFEEPKNRTAAAVAAVLLTLLVGYVDYISGPKISMAGYYLLPLALAAWSVGRAFAALIVALGIGIWILANVYNGDPTFLRPGIVAWNTTVQLVSDGIVIFFVSRLKELQSVLEARVRERAAALTQEISERERIQEELLDVSEREQRRVGRDLHDGLCQHLAATALNCQLLGEELAEQGSPSAPRARAIVGMIEKSIRLSRQSARGLDPVAIDAEGLMAALEEMASTTTDLFRVSCSFDCESPVLIHDANVTDHFYRIAQEAVRNAVSHARAQSIAIRLDATDGGIELRVEDDGIGFVRDASPAGGMGLRIMPLRARLIGAEFVVARRTEGGTAVTCTLPIRAKTARREREHAHI